MKMSPPQQKNAAVLSLEYNTATSILDFYNVKYTTRSLQQSLHRSEAIHSFSQLALALYQHGVQTTFMTPRADLFERFPWHKYLQRVTGELDPEMPDTNELERIIAHGVWLKVSAITEAILDNEVHQKHPVILSADPFLPVADKETLVAPPIVTGEEKDNYLIFQPTMLHTTQQLPKGQLIAFLENIKQEDPFAGSIICTQPRS